MLLHTVLQDALSEVVFVDDITACMEGRSLELPEIAETVLKTIRKEVEEEGLKSSITERGKEGKSKVSASCSHLEDKFREAWQTAWQHLEWI